MATYNFNFSINMDRKKLTALSLACLATGALAGTAALSFADGDVKTSTVDSGNLVIPYDGFLMLDSASVNGARSLKFELFQQATGGTAVWTETQSVNLYNGRFSVGLGSVQSLTSTILDAEKLFLGVTILEDDGQGNITEVALSGRQAIEPAPHAAWSGHSANFKVANTIKIGNTQQAAEAPLDINAISGGEMTAKIGSVTVDTGSGQGLANVMAGASLIGGTYQYQSTRGASRIRYNDSELQFYVATLGNNGGQMAGDTVGWAEKLRINSSGSLALGALESTGALTAGGNLFANSNLDVSGTSSFTGAATFGNGASVTGNMSATGTMTANTFDGAIRPAYQAWGGGNVGAGGAAIVNDNGTYQALMITGNNSAGARRIIEMFDDVIVDDDLQVKGAASIGGNTAITGNLSVTGKINGLELVGRVNRNTQGTSNMGVTSGEGFCFLTEMAINHNADNPGEARCNVYVDSGDGNKWKLYLNEGGGANLDTWCTAQCIKY